MREMILNHASLDHAPRTVEAMTPVVANMAVGMAGLVREKCVAKVLRTLMPLHESLCGGGASLFEAVLSLRKTSEKDEAVFFMSLVQKSPLLEGLDRDAASGRFLLCEPVEPPGKNGEPLILCACTNGVSVSVPSEPRWSLDEVDIRFREMVGEDIAEIEERIDNLCDSATSAPILARHRTALRSGVKPTTLWEGRALAFPNLAFGLDVEQQLSDLNVNEFGAVLKRLGELELAAEEWSRSKAAMPTWRSKVTPESEGTMKNFAAERTFLSADGRSQVYELHARFGSAGRIHLRVEASTRTIEIGYIGRKLPTMLYRT